MTVDWQNRHWCGQPRMISMAIRSCGVWMNGTTGLVGSGMASRSLPTVQAITSLGTSARVRCTAASVPSAWYSGS
jgi:hypothetical protein